MIDREGDDVLIGRVTGLLARALPGPWDKLLSLRGGPRSLAMEQATLELAHLAPELVIALTEAHDQLRAVEEERAELQAELEESEAAEPDRGHAMERERLTEENDYLRAEVARLRAALNGSLVEGVPT